MRQGGKWNSSLLLKTQFCWGFCLLDCFFCVLFWFVFCSHSRLTIRTHTNMHTYTHFCPPYNIIQSHPKLDFVPIANKSWLAMPLCLLLLSLLCGVVQRSLMRCKQQQGMTKVLAMSVPQGAYTNKGRKKRATPPENCKTMYTVQRQLQNNDNKKKTLKQSANFCFRQVVFSVAHA